MKKALHFCIYLLLILTLFYPIGVIISSLFGYRFTLNSPLVFTAFSALLSIFIVITDIICKKMDKAPSVISALSLLAVINAAFYVFAKPQRTIILCVIITAFCCFYLTVRYWKSSPLHKTAFIISAIISVPIGLLAFISLALGNFGQNTVVQTVESPNSEYYAQVIDSDQGALGGDTIVNVCEDKGTDFIVFKIEKKPQTIYLGNWGEFENMSVYWENDNCLIINGVKYEID